MIYPGGYKEKGIPIRQNNVLGKKVMRAWGEFEEQGVDGMAVVIDDVKKNLDYKCL